MILLKSKYSGRCKSCRYSYRVGDLIRWSKEAGAYCVPCFVKGKHKTEDDKTEGDLVVERINEEASQNGPKTSTIDLQRVAMRLMPHFPFTWEYRATGDLKQLLQTAPPDLF